MPATLDRNRPFGTVRGPGDIPRVKIDGNLLYGERVVVYVQEHDGQMIHFDVRGDEIELISMWDYRLKYGKGPPAKPR